MQQGDSASLRLSIAPNVIETPAYQPPQPTLPYMSICW